VVENKISRGETVTIHTTKSSILEGMRTLFSHGLFRGGMTRAILLIATAGLVCAGLNLQAHADDAHSRKYTPPPPTSAIKVTVLRSTNGKPIPDAAVVFHPIRDGKDEGALELKSDPDGVVKIDVIPIGDTVRLQIIANGWQTFGEDYKIETDSKEIVVKMKRPSAQVSAYESGGSTADATSTTAPQGQSSSAKPNDQTPIPK
jgi:hypothetical protein